VYFGNLAYGVEAAARTYFGNSARELELAEAALLGGLTQSPVAYNPLVNLDAARQRQQVVLNLMQKKGFVSESEVQLARAEALHFVGQDPTGYQNAPGLIAPHFVTYVRNLLETEYGAEAVNDGGMSVVTTLDLDLQQRAEAIIRAHLDALSQLTRHGSAPDFNVHDGALVAIEPGTGDILAMVGSADYFDRKIDGAVNVALANRQPGSAIKPITYATAFAWDYTPATVLSDVPTAFTTREGLPYQPQNYDHTWHGPMSLRQALATSNNIIAVKVLDHVGIDAMIATAQSLGISTFGGDRHFGLSLTLAGGEVSLLELTGAYATFANAGDWLAPRAILAVTTDDATPQRVLSVLRQPSSVNAPVAYLITSILSDDGARIGAFGEDSVLKLSRPAAAKTGTTTDWRDNWTLGYTPDLAVGVWVGNADNTPMYQVSGITGAGPIWHDFMEAAHAGRPARDFVRPTGIVDADICDTSGLLATNLCPRRRHEVFIAGTEPIRADDSYMALSVDSATGLLWADGCTGQRITKVYRVLPLEAQQWGRENGFESMPQYDCKNQIAENGQPPAVSSAASLIVTSPAPNTTFALTPYLPSEAQQIEIGARLSTRTLVHDLRLLVDGQALATFTEPPYRALWQLHVGEHTVQAVGIDGEGRRVESTLVRFRVQ